MGDVVVLGGLTTLEIPVQRVLDGARDHKTVLVLSYDETGKFCVASSKGDMLMLQDMALRFIHKYQRGDYDG